MAKIDKLTVLPVSGCIDHGGIWCRPCERDPGEKRKAHRVMPKRGGHCEEHYRQEAGLPQRTSEAEAFIARWEKIVEERGALAEVQEDFVGSELLESESEEIDA